MAEESDMQPLELNWQEQMGQHVRQLAAGGCAGAVAKTCTAPLSRLTILFQVHSMVTTKADHPEYAQGVWAGLRKILKKEGILAFWKGNGTSVLHRIPYSAANFFMYESFKPHVGTALGQDEEAPGVRFLAGAMSAGLSTAMCYPLDLVRTRLATQHPSQPRYHGIWHACKLIRAEEGKWGLYRGLGPSLCVQVPNLAISYTSYGTLKDWLRRYSAFRDSSGGVNVPGTLVCGGLSGVSASLVVYPMDMVRRRMQIEGLHLRGHLRGPFDELHWILRHEGLRGLYRGLAAELLKVVPMVCLTFGMYEFMRNQLKVGKSFDREKQLEQQRKRRRAVLRSRPSRS